MFAVLCKILILIFYDLNTLVRCSRRAFAINAAEMVSSCRDGIVATQPVKPEQLAVKKREKLIQHVSGRPTVPEPFVRRSNDLLRFR
jgi:hypothetical protein